MPLGAAVLLPCSLLRLRYSLVAGVGEVLLDALRCLADTEEATDWKASTILTWRSSLASFLQAAKESPKKEGCPCVVYGGRTASQGCIEGGMRE